MKIKYQMVCEMMPNILEGTVNGINFYFRARRGSYSLDIFKENGPLITVDSGETNTAGWWERRTAIKKLKRSIYRASKHKLLKV